ncbi:cyclohexanone monooxygenase/phenylacetone monooxygenase [Pseudonocardia thermophila]|uniref:Cyclohexanone monooxygenase/phenylacetone monooxygenase n=1 Tax=Pseudonocardia thermophila TaxID=1848 RepID=A0A1M6WR87_PSETH|nr:NAD(P)/FAD-dependent oxidoreductase [Pseudonocardia thermophila]SHK96228.1 cyclohexanone monooxygenase/phenylacetone monooxygenase [Pseudonocardia thermophila]
MTTARNSTVDAEVLVVGAGFSGLAALYHFRNAGHHVMGVETNGDVGGAWYNNRYPGARCDVESHDYSLSMSPEVEQEWTWSERFSDADEIRRYLGFVANRLDLRRLISFSTTVTGMDWDETSRSWRVTFSERDPIRVRYVVMATGPLTSPIKPQFPGMDAFAGRILHTAEWPREEVDLHGHRVAVIGTGSSGVQAIPIIAEQAERLYVLQRTPNFVVPARNRPITEAEDRAVKATYRERRATVRTMSSAYLKELPTQSAFDVSEEERNARYQRFWDLGGTNITSAFTDLKTSEEANATLAAFIHGKIREIVRDPEVARKLMPTGYPVGARRICVGTNYYETFNRDNVELVDLLGTESITGFEARGIRTDRRLLEVDDIVLATGFDAMTGVLTRLDIKGANGELLRDAWRGGPVNHLGIAVHGFPNFFYLAGPGSPSVLANVVTTGEQQVEWLTELLNDQRDRGFTRIEAEAAAADAWVKHANELAEGTMFFKAKSWYIGANVPGKPRVFMPYAGGFPAYARRTEEVAAAGYSGFVRS